MAVVAHRPAPAAKPELEITQTHADVTRDVVATLGPPSTRLPPAAGRRGRAVPHRAR